MKKKILTAVFVSTTALATAFVTLLCIETVREVNRLLDSKDIQPESDRKAALYRYE